MDKKSPSCRFLGHLFRCDSHVSFSLAFASATILGNYTRVALNELSSYEPSYIAPGSVLWSNLVACMIMGMLQDLKKGGWFEPDELAKTFVVLTTGYCGALSSYSTMMLEMFLHSTSLMPSDTAQGMKLPNRAYGIMEFLSVLLVQLLVSMGSYIFGRSFAKNILLSLGPDMDLPEEKNELVPEPSVTGVENLWTYKLVKTFHLMLSIAALPLTALIIVLGCVYDNNSRSLWTLPELLAIPAGFLRYYLALWFNQSLEFFPVGTFLANQLAVITLAVFTMCLRGRSSEHSYAPIANTLTQCHILTALSTGFSGTLSTVSTFINEGYHLPLVKALIYYGTSISLSYCILVIMLGSLAWTRGLTLPTC
ncbi:hypothetical protein HG536_0E05830 [Torulaspora globosa]|uniref:Uncharacterized protein n=1 Tax=Torulaspora globosa TaxID=48254 RepID=A0A7G3ZJI6_9SACH|nr:uncharacterized protein HG536_0E05830 [Torulaspora globosa]QLL33672.1 hypothetical protein HG536_0E05830 [Torulaspora globosa]